ncbi:MAG: DNA gyrase inhibitor YacG [Acidobacteriota bacterium]
MKRPGPNCPTCGQKISGDHSFMPFCSERCRLLDLGKWLDGDYRIKGQKISKSETEAEE